MKDQYVGQIFFEDTGYSEIRQVKRKGNTAEITAVLQDADNENRNKRIYPKKVIQEGLKHPFIIEKMKTKSLAGEMNHPDPELGMGRQLKIDMKNISHFIKDFWWDTSNPKLLMGNIQTAATAVGKDLCGMILENQMISSFSMRGAGDVVKRGGTSFVKGPLRIITWDAVHYPSHQVAYQTSLSEHAAGFDISKKMLAEYIASHSEHVEMLAESIAPFVTDLDYAIEGNNIILRNKVTRQIEASALMEENLRLEYEDALISKFSW